MKNRYWNLFAEMKYREYYAELYLSRILRYDKWTTAVCWIATVGSVYGWWQTKYQIISTVILVSSQLIQTLKPLFPWSSRIAALKFFIPEFRSFNIQFERNWDMYSDLPDDQLSEIIKNQKLEANILEEHYLGVSPLPDRFLIRRKAELRRDGYLNRNFNISKEVSNSVQG